jgi:hypothetical protein
MIYFYFKKYSFNQVQLLEPVVLATWKVEVRRTEFQYQPGQMKVFEIPSQPIARRGGR